MVWGASDLLVNPNPASEVHPHPFTVALTGGIASGKTLISDEFDKLDVAVIDTDVIAHSLVEPGQPALKEIESAFGSNIIDDSGRLKRRELRSLIFSDPIKRKKLESILHPQIRQAATEAIAKATSAYCILVIPLLVETGLQDRVNRVLLVDCPVELQLTRLQSRDEISDSVAQRIIDAQSNRGARLAVADDVLVNDGRRDELPGLVGKLDDYYRQLIKQGKTDAVGLRLP